RAPSGGALRARATDAVKRGRALLEGRRHPPQRPVEHRSGKTFKEPRLEGEIDRKTDVGATVAGSFELPLVVQIFERSLDIIDADLVRPLLHDAAGEPFLERVEADHEVRDRLM